MLHPLPPTLILHAQARTDLLQGSLCPQLCPQPSSSLCGGWRNAWLPHCPNGVCGLPWGEELNAEQLQGLVLPWVELNLS